MPRLTRAELHDLVWSEPLRSLAPRFGISDVALRKRCQTLGISVPERGYWTKLKAGKPVVRAALSPRVPGADDTVVIGAGDNEWRLTPEQRLALPVPPEPTFDEPIEDVRARTAKRLGKQRIESELSAPHPAVRRLLQADARRAEQYARYRFAWDKPQFESGFERRRLVLLNTLGFGLARLGAKLETYGPTGRHVSVRIDSTSIELRLDHPEAAPSIHGEWQVRTESGGAMQLLIVLREDELGVRTRWTDEGRTKLENRIAEATVEILVAAEVAYRRRLRSGHVWALRERERLKLEVEKRRAEAERRAAEKAAVEAQARREFLMTQARDWRLARDLRDFVADVLAAAGPAEAEALSRWADWAREEADKIDPVKTGFTRPT